MFLSVEFELELFAQYIARRRAFSFLFVGVFGLALFVFFGLSKTNPEGEETPAVIKKDTDEDDTEKIEELISDKPKKTNKASPNTPTNKKKSSTTRDVLSNNSSSNSTDKTNSNNNSTTGNKNSTTSPTNKTTNSTDTKKPTNDTTKPTSNKTTTPGTGDVRQRKTP